MPLDRTLDHLARLYGAHADPWGHLTRAYEREKYARTLDALCRRRFRQGLEVGCGIGALSELLAPRCERLTAIDCAPGAIVRARDRLRGIANLALVEGAAPDDLPPLAPDLIVLSEVLYFMTEHEIDRLAAWVAAHATADATVLVVSWTGETGEALSGHASVDRFAAALPRWSGRRSDHAGYRIETFSRAHP